MSDASSASSFRRGVFGGIGLSSWLVILLAGVAVLVSATSFVIGYGVLRRTTLDQIDRTLLVAADMARESLPNGYHDRIVDAGSVGDEQYLAIVENYDQLCLEHGLEYIWSVIEIDGVIRFSTGTSRRKQDHHDYATFFEEHSNPAAYSEAFRTMEVQHARIADKSESLRSVLVPRLDSHGRKYLFGACMKLDDVDAMLARHGVAVLSASMLVCVAAIVVGFVLARRVSRSIGALAEGAQAISQGCFDRPIPVGGVRECRVLAASFNRMSETLADQMESVRESEERARQLSDATWEAIVIHEDGVVLEANEQYYHMFGYEPGELLGQEGISRTTTPESNELVRRQIAEGKLGFYRVVGKRKDGTEFPMEVRVRTIDYRGRKLRVAAIRDMTDQERANRALQQSEARLQSIFRAAPVGIGLVSDRYIKQVNARVCEMTGYAREELLERNARILYLTDEDYEFVGREKYRQIAECGTGTVETRWRCKDGGVIDVLLSSTPLDPENLSSGVMFTSLNITERRLAEAALSERERMLTTLMGNLPGMVYRCRNDRDWTMEFVSDGCLELTGYSADDLLENRELSFSQTIFEDDRERVWDVIQDALAERRAFEVTYCIRSRSGETKWVWERGVGVYSDEDEPLALEGFITDITERKRAEEKLREQKDLSEDIINSLPGLFYMFDRERFARWNHEWESKTGYTADELSRMYAPDFFEGDDVRLVEERLDTVFDTGYAQVEVTLVTKAGARIPYFFTGTRRVYGGEPYVIGLGVDVTERNLAELAARQAQDRLLGQQRSETERVRSELDKAREQLVNQTRLATIGQVAASMAHELRNPLGAVRNAAFLLNRRMSDSDETLTSHLEIIDEEIAAADRVIRNMLEMARAKDPCKEEIGLREAVSAVVARVGPRGGCGCHVSVAPDSMVVRADPVQFEQVLSNLLANAYQAVGDEGDVWIEGRREADCDTLTVRDSGPGIADENRARVFEPLFTTRTKGTGLGLTICRQIIERHGGSLELLESEEGRGAAFRVCLPR